MTPFEWQEDVLDAWLGRRRDDKWASARCGLAVPRQNGKNAVIEVRELYGMAVLGERFLHTAHEVKTARKAFLRICSFFENERQYPELAALVSDIRKTNGQEAVLLKNGGGVEFIARSRGSGRGFTVDVLVCDEAQELTDEELAALLPTISASPSGNPQVIVTGTPPDPERPAQGEVFRRYRNNGEAKRDARLAWIDFGAADGPLPDISDNAAIQGHNPSVGVLLSMEEVEGERSSMSPEMFARERMGWWGDPASHGLIFPRWSTLAGDASDPAALGIAADLDARWLVLAEASMDGYVGVVTPAAFSDARVSASDRDLFVSEVARISKERDIPVGIQVKGPAWFLKDDIEAAGGRVEPVDMDGFVLACANTRDAADAADAEAIRHGNFPILNEAVARAQWRKYGDRLVISRKTGDISALEAALIARHVATSVSDPLDNIW